MGIPASRFIGMTWRKLGRVLSPVESGQFSCLENSSAVGQFLLCSDQMITVLPKSVLSWGDAPRRCCWWLGVWKLSLQHIQSLGYSQPRSSLFQLSCSKWPTQKNNGQFLKNGVNPKTFSYFIGNELWIPPTLLSSGNLLLSCASLTSLFSFVYPGET